MMRFLCTLVFFLMGMRSVSPSPCESFANRCQTQLGHYVENEPSSHQQIFTLNEHVNLYFSFTQPAQSSAVKILASIFYGNLEIFAKINSEVSLSNYDFKTKKFQDILQLESNQGQSLKEINILVRTTTKSKFRIIPTSQDLPIKLFLGLQQIDLLTESHGKNKYSFQLFNQSKISINLTPFIESDPNLKIVGPLVNGNSRTWSSDKIGSDSLVLIPTHEEIGGTFALEINSVNASYYTILMVDESQSFPPTSQHPIQLLSGFSIHQQSETEAEYYYILHVPSNIISDIVIMLTPLYGDADLYVNPMTAGFYYTNQSSPESSKVSKWSSQLSYGPDSVLIDHLDPSYSMNGQDYYITVRSVSSSQFLLRGYSADTVITITEGSNLIDQISAKTYHYYRFVDGNLNEDLVFDVSPFNGDPDLLVACTINPTGDDTGYPSRTFPHYNFSSVRSGEDSILIPKSTLSKTCPNGVYYLAIYAFSATRVSLIATHQGGAINLHDGLPVQSSGFANIGRYFRYFVGSELEQLTISLTPDQGDSDLFVSIGREVTHYQWDYFSVNGGTNIDQIIIPETSMCINCVVNILVLSPEKCTFSLVASMEDTTIQLSNLIPLQESVSYESIQYYTLQASENGTAIVVLTVFSGSPELYMSVKIEYPTAHSNDTVVNKLALIGNLPIASIPIKKGEVLSIGVGGAGLNATYTIRAHVREENVEPLFSLLEGIPQSDSILRDGPEWNYYQINMPAGHESISLRATSLVGNIDVYIMRCPFQGTECLGTHSRGSHSYLPNETHYQLTTENLVHDWITVTRNDNHSVSYIVGVKSQSLYAEYHISMTLESSTLMISPGTPVSDQVQEGEYDYFSVYMDENPQEFTIRLTPFSGDADLFVSTTYKKPNRSHYTWYSASFGEDSVVIDPETDANACKGCVYYISVFGFRPSTYSLSVRTVSTVGRLIDGVPVTDEVDYFSYLRYTFKNTYGIGRGFRLVLTALTGSPSLYVTLDSVAPSFLHHDYSASSWLSSSVTINILPTDPQYQPCLDADCDIRIGVYGIVRSNYILSLTSSLSSTLLQLNIPVTIEVAANSYDYFKVILSDKSANLRLSLVEFSGITIMYVSCRSLFPNTTLSSHEWYYYPSNRNQDNYFEITPLQASDKHCPPNGEFHVGVKGITSASYSVMASSTQNNTIPRLIAGTHVPAIVEYGHFDYYYYRPNENQGDNIRLQVTVNRGDVDVYIGSSWDNRPYFSTANNRVMSYLYKSASLGDESILIRHKAIADICNDRVNDDCYIVIGVYGVYQSNEVKSSYTLQLTTEDMTVTLGSGQSVRGALDRHEMAYYKYTVTEPKKDVVISVTPFLGDPDMFVSLDPLTHPTSTNYTWMVAYWGADVLTIQYTDLAKYCTPVPSRGKNCDLHIGIYAWQNTTYSIMAQMNEGSKHPIILTDGQPQNSFVELGSYIYYSFYVNGQVNHKIIDGLQISLTSSDGDQDIYVAFNSTEPGKENFDYKSSNFGGISDEIYVSANMKHFCLNCYVTIAVFGFKAGHYSIVATSKGIVELQSGVAVGGHLDQAQYRYYSLYNANPTALITFSLTALSGDPDLYVNIFSVETDMTKKPYTYPTNSNYLWRSIHAGRDDILIDYSDHSFCVDCTYVIGVYSYRNSSYTLLATNKDDAIITLAPNRPQVVHVRDVAKLHFFKLISMSSAEDLTVSLTNYGTAHCSMYMEKYPLSSYNGSLPNPSDPSSYSYSNIRSGGDSLFAKGPNNEPVIFVVGVKINSPTSFSIIMSSSAQSVILRSGVPQIHYAHQGYMAQFIFYLSESADTQITITAMSGDPDLFISEANAPSCKADETMYWRVQCSNYTWASTTYSTDQLIISKDLPCSPVMPGTTVRDNCNPTKYGRGPLYIGVYGYSTSRFMIMASVRGEHITLLAGKPQPSITSQAIVCSNRNPDNGVCSSSESTTHVSAAYFTFSLSDFQISNNKNMNNNAIYMTIQPSCNATTTASASCVPGCDCDPLELYVTSCLATKCTAGDRYPSYLPGHYKGHQTITSTSNSMLISTLTPSLYCNPSITGETCIYYLVLLSRQTKKDISFTIDIQNPDDVSMITCDETPSPDGYRISKLVSNPLASSNLIATKSFGKYYELCSSSTSSNNKEKILVSVEQCYGNSYLYACSNNACDSYLPSENSWEYYSDSQKLCQTTSKTGKSLCAPNFDSISRPTLSLPEKSGNYHIKVNGTGRYYFNIQNTINGDILEPKFQFDYPTMVGGIRFVGRTDTSLTISWDHIGILMPGESMPKKTINILYNVYIFDENELIGVAIDQKVNFKLPLTLETQCGLEYAASLMPSSSRIISLPAVDIGSSSMSHTIPSLNPNTNYAIYLLSVCDSQCLKQISKTLVTSHYMSCSGVVDCHPQKYTYGSLVLQTSNKHHQSGGESTEDSSSINFKKMDNLILLVVICIITVVSFLFGMMSYYYRNKKELDDIQTFEMVNFENSSSGSSIYDQENSFHSSSHSSTHVSNSSKGGNGLMSGLFSGLTLSSSSPGRSSRGPVLTSQTPRLSQGSGGGGNRSMMSKINLGKNTSNPFSSYSPLIKDDQEDDEEVIINL